MDNMAYGRKVSRCTSKRSRKDVTRFEFSRVIDGRLEEEKSDVGGSVVESCSLAKRKSDEMCRAWGLRKGSGLTELGKGDLSNISLGCMRTSQHRLG
jgi:hypothetical protein